MPSTVTLQAGNGHICIGLATHETLISTALALKPQLWSENGACLAKRQVKGK